MARVGTESVLHSGEKVEYVYEAGERLDVVLGVCTRPLLILLYCVIGEIRSVS